MGFPPNDGSHQGPGASEGTSWPPGLDCAGEAGWFSALLASVLQLGTCFFFATVTILAS